MARKDTRKDSEPQAHATSPPAGVRRANKWFAHQPTPDADFLDLSRAHELIAVDQAERVRRHLDLYKIADGSLGTTLLKKLTLSESVRLRVVELIGAVATPVREGQLAHPGRFAQQYSNLAYGDEDSAISSSFWGLVDYLTAAESINSVSLFHSVSGVIRLALEQMDEPARKKLIAGLMAYIGELQTSGVLESVPSDRLARVAKLIGEAAEIVSAAPAKYQPLFRDRPVDEATGKKPTAVEWFDQVWKPRVEAGEATGDDIRGIDPAFYNNFAAALSKRGEKVRDYLPPSPTRGKKDETAEQRAERLRRHSRESKRRARQLRSDPKT